MSKGSSRRGQPVPVGAERQQGAELSVRNARRLYVAGALLLRHGAPAPAAPLLGTALEESVKSPILSSPPGDVPDRELDEQVDRVLHGPRVHEARSDLAHEWYAAVEPSLALALLIDGAMRLANLFIRPNADPPSAWDADTYQRVVLELAPALATARGLRDRGLYVDWQDGQWTDPATLAADDVVELRRLVARYVRAALRNSRAVSWR